VKFKGFFLLTVNFQEELVDSTTSKDPVKFEMTDGGGMLVNLLDKKTENQIVNGVGQKIVANHLVSFYC